MQSDYKRAEYTVYTRNPRAKEEQLWLVGIFSGVLLLGGILQLIDSCTSIDLDAPPESED